MRTFILPALSVLCLTACDQISEVAAPDAEPAPAEVVETLRRERRQLSNV